MKKYNGFENYKTLNVALWMQNDQQLYGIAKETKDLGYNYFLECMDFINNEKTGDGISFFDEEINIDEIEEVMESL